MAAAEKATTGNDGFTMDFTINVVSSIVQDVEDVARQGALGNFRKARTMYEEALEVHRDQFPVHAEYLRLCLDGGDWFSLAGASDHEAVGWSNLATSLVELLHEFGMTMLEGNSRLTAYLTEIDAASFKLESLPSLVNEFALKRFDDYSNEEVCLKLRRLKPG
jgi:hypothetical protein